MLVQTAVEAQVCVCERVRDTSASDKKSVIMTRNRTIMTMTTVTNNEGILYNAGHRLHDDKKKNTTNKKTPTTTMAMANDGINYNAGPRQR